MPLIRARPRIWPVPDAGPMQVLSAALDRLPAAGSIRASTPAILAKLRETPGLEPRNLNNLLSRVRSLLECLARVAGDRWENVTPRMIHDWCEGDWADAGSGRVPSRASGSKKVRRWSARTGAGGGGPDGSDRSGQRGRSVPRAAAAALHAPASPTPIRRGSHM